MFTTPINTNAQSIDRVLAAGLPVLLVFWRKDNSSSRQLEPALNNLAAAFAGQVLIARIDAQDNSDLVRRYAVTQLPGLVFIKEGKPIAQSSGAAPESALRAWLDYLTDGGERPPLPSGPSAPIQGAATNSDVPHPQQAQSSGAPHARSTGPIVLSDATFDKTIGTNGEPVLVDFWAPWCGPCRMVAPSVEQLAKEFAGRAVVAKLNVDDNPRTAQRFGISSIPALYVFKNGKVVERLVGAQPASALRQALTRHV